MTVAIDMTAKKPPVPSLAEVKRQAAEDAARDAIWRELRRHDYSPTEVAKALDVPGGSGNVIREMRRLGMYNQYLAERTKHRIKTSQKT